MDKGVGLVAGFFGLAALAGVVVAGSKPAQAAAPPPPGPTPSGPGATVGPGTPLQSRPIPAWSTLSDAGRAAYLDVQRQQLAFLASTYSDDSLRPTGDGHEALASFLRQYPRQVAAYGYTTGAGADLDTNIVATLNAVDDAARDAFPSGAAPQAPDYRAPSSGALPASAPAPTSTSRSPAAPSGAAGRVPPPVGPAVASPPAPLNPMLAAARQGFGPARGRTEPPLTPASIRRPTGGLGGG
jgi:hypothetical protein